MQHLDNVQLVTMEIKKSCMFQEMMVGFSFTMLKHWRKLIKLILNALLYV